MTDFDGITKKDCLMKAIPKRVKLGPHRTLILQSVINEIKEHGRSSMNKEVCGVLVGNLCWDRTPYLFIDARIEGKFADHQAGSVTFTSETWDFIHQELAEKYPGKRIVGWYHTHPGFGIFLSNMDFFIHENFFSIRWQTAYVYDPQADTDGFFFWEGSNLEQRKVSILPDVPAIEARPAAPRGEKISVLITEEDEQKDQRMRLFFAAVIVCFLFLAITAGIIIAALYHQNRELREKQNNPPTVVIPLERVPEDALPRPDVKKKPQAIPLVEKEQKPKKPRNAKKETPPAKQKSIKKSTPKKKTADRTLHTPPPKRQPDRPEKQQKKQNRKSASIRN